MAESRLACIVKYIGYHALKEIWERILRIKDEIIAVICFIAFIGISYVAIVTVGWGLYLHGLACIVTLIYMYVSCEVGKLENIIKVGWLLTFLMCMAWFIVILATVYNRFTDVLSGSWLYSYPTAESIVLIFWFIPVGLWRWGGKLYRAAIEFCDRELAEGVE
jgi:hypothetical protein